MAIRKYAVTFTIDTGDDEHAHDAIVDVMEDLAARGTFTNALIEGMEANACVTCFVIEVEVNTDGSRLDKEG